MLNYEIFINEFHYTIVSLFIDGGADLVLSMACFTPTSYVTVKIGLLLQGK